MATAYIALHPAPVAGLPLHIRLPSKGVAYTPKAFWNLCQLNPDLDFERNADGSVAFLPPAGAAMSRRTGHILGQLFIWSKANRKGIPFGVSTGFTLPNGAVRAPDAAWVRSDRWNALSEEQQDQFPPIAPDFIAEVRSQSDKLPALRKKMREYIAQGVQLGWLIDPIAKSVEVYRQNEQPKRLENPKSKTLRGDSVLPGFILDLKPIWSRKSH